jgi:hypothetical protein
VCDKTISILSVHTQRDFIKVRKHKDYITNIRVRKPEQGLYFVERVMCWC